MFGSYYFQFLFISDQPLGPHFTYFNASLLLLIYSPTFRSMEKVGTAIHKLQKVCVSAYRSGKYAQHYSRYNV
jgi:hypothetical protein